MLNDNWLIKSLDKVGSTQDYAKNLDVSNRQIAVIARNQTKGYGQNGREWISFQDNLYVSLVVPAKKVSSDITLIASMAVGDVILNHGVNIQYKWVNDIYIENKKVAGILTEYFKGNLIIGIGLNIKNHPQNTINFPATNLLEHGIDISSDKFLELMLKSFTQKYNKWLDSGFKSFRMLWKSRGYKFNQHITISDEDSAVSGMFFDIDDSGRAIIQNDEGLHTVERGSLR